MWLSIPAHTTLRLLFNGEPQGSSDAISLSFIIGLWTTTSGILDIGLGGTFVVSSTLEVLQDLTFLVSVASACLFSIDKRIFETTVERVITVCG